jgi:hypothetical protein
MSSLSRLAVTAFGLALLASTVPVPSPAADASAAPAASPNAAMSVMPAAMPPTAITLTNVRNLHARKLIPTGASLTGLLQQTNSCNKVWFRATPILIVPPVYQAVQQRVRLLGCVILNGHYVPAAIAIPRNAPFVTVRAKNGTFKVIVH